MRYTSLLLLSICLFHSSCKPDKKEPPVPVVSALGIHEFRDVSGVRDAALCDDGRILVLTADEPARIVGVNTNGTLWFKHQLLVENVFHFQYITEGPGNGIMLQGKGPHDGTDSSHIRLLSLDDNMNVKWLARSGNAIIGFQQEQAMLLRTRDRNYLLVSTEMVSGGTQVNMTWCNSEGHRLRSVGIPTTAGWYHVVEMEDGSFMFTGVADDPNAIYSRLALLKVSAQGDVIWYKTVYHGMPIEQVSQALPLPGGGLVLCGVTFTDTPPIGRSPFMIKVSPGGDLAWKNYYDVTGRYGPFNSVTTNGNGGYMVAGASADATFSSLQVDLVSISADGTELWRKNYSAGDNIKKIFPRPDGGYTIIGDAAPGSSGFFVLITDKDGNVE